MLLAFEDVGPGPVVVLIHGFPLDRTMWQAQFTEIGSLYRIIAPDLRGAGETAVPDGVYTIDLLADDVIETLDDLNLTGPVVLGGLSMGGYVALSLVARYPDRFRALMLMNTRAGADSFAVAEGRESLAKQVEQSGKVDAVVDAMIPKLLAPVSYVTHAERLRELKERALRANPLGIANTLRGLAIRPDRTADLARIHVPTLVIAGAEDQLIPIDESKHLASAIPHARLEVIPNAGHLAPIENPTATNAAILKFLREVGD